jgi:hypothetical protein
MKFGVLIPLLLYYGIISLLFFFGGSVFTGYTSSDITTYYTTNDYSGGGISTDWLDYAVTFLGFIGLGIGLPSSVPVFIAVIFSIWTISINIIAVALVVQVIRGS